ncbi:MAG: mycofactocin precursor peptide peptidase, partial [Frankiales bacterium]|nr:mycofactocin precursor peptide peptidase [Frankiales bacterium]
MTRLGDLTWTRVEAEVLAVPLGSTEQHGPHLPLSTDTDIAQALANGLAA